MAFNRQSLGEVGDPLIYKTFRSSDPIIDFFGENFDLLAKRHSGYVAVLRGLRESGFNNYASHREVGLLSIP